MAISDVPAAPWHSSEFEYDVAVIGLGRIGLPTALACYAGGRSVVGIDISADRLISVGAGLTDLADSDRQLLNDALLDDRFQMTADLRTLSGARSVVICVPTSVDDYFTPDLSALKSACASVVENAKPGQLLVLTSTTYVGCTEELLVRPLTARGLEVGVDVFVAFSADYLDTDSAVEHETVARIVGGATPACTERAVEALRGCATNVHEVPSLAVAEMAKLLENTFRAVNVTLAEELAEICRAMTHDLTDVTPRSMRSNPQDWHGLYAS